MLIRFKDSPEHEGSLGGEGHSRVEGLEETDDWTQHERRGFSRLPQCGQQGIVGYAMALSREQFSQNLAKGTHAVREATLRLCWNQVPEDARYFLLLNSSFDGNPLADGEYLFPDHSKLQTDTRIPRTHDEVVARLWRDGKVPEWIDITPCEVDGRCAYYELRCCGRFTDKDELLYHVQEGYPPFHLFGPLVPSIDYNLKNHGKFDLHWHRDRL